MLAFILEKGDEKLLGALALQKCKDFSVYLPADDPAVADYEGRLDFRHGDWQLADEPLLCFLQPGALPNARFVRRVLRSARRHPDYDVFHVKVGKGFPCKADAKKLFKLTQLEHIPAPLSSFVFRGPRLREKAVFRADGSLNALATVLACAPVRKVCWEQLPWTAPQPPRDSDEAEKLVKDRLDFLRWTESFFGDDDYPLSVGDQLQLFAREVAKLHPAHDPEELKEIMDNFQVSQGTIRKMRASSALKAAIKERENLL